MRFLLALLAVQLSTNGGTMRFWTDSNGIAAIDDEALNGREVLFKITSHGYEYPDRILGGPARILRVEAGGHAELRIRRSIAERLYRVTGADIYRDRLLAGMKAPIAQPLLNGA